MLSKHLPETLLAANRMGYADGYEDGLKEGERLTKEKREPNVSVVRKEDIAILRTAIDRSGMSDRRFAAYVLVRNERTLRRWLAGDRAIPKAVIEFLGAYLKDVPLMYGASP